MDTAEDWRLTLTRIYFLLYCKYFPISILIIFRLLSIMLLTKHSSCQDSEPASSTWPDLKSFHLQTAILPASSNFSKLPLNHHADPRFNLATCFLHTVSQPSKCSTNLDRDSTLNLSTIKKRVVRGSSNLLVISLGLLFLQTSETVCLLSFLQPVFQTYRCFPRLSKNKSFSEIQLWRIFKTSIHY